MLAAFLACLVLAAEPADWEKAESAVSQKHHASDQGLRPRRRRLLLARRQDHHLPGRGEGQAATRSTRSSRMDLATGRRHRVSTGVGKTTCSFFRPDGKKIIFASSPPRPRRQEALRRGIPAAQGGRGVRQTPPLQMGLRPVHDDLRGQPRRHGPQTAHPRQRLQRRGQLFAGRQADRLQVQPRRGRTASKSTSWTPTARTSAS